MQKSTLLVVATTAIALLGASTCFAQEATVAPEFQNFTSTKTRAQVRAETAEAIRLGLVFFGEGGAPVATPEALERIRLAGLRALQWDQTLASK